MDKVNVYEKLDLFDAYWQPRIVGAVNDSHVKVAKFLGEFLWHVHEEDEMFYVLKGRLTVRFRDGDVPLGVGEFIIVPKGTEHMPVAEEEVHVLLFESKDTVNTGNVTDERTVANPERI